MKRFIAPLKRRKMNTENKLAANLDMTCHGFKKVKAYQILYTVTFLECVSYKVEWV